MLPTMQSITSTVQEHWGAMVASLITGLFLLRQKFVMDDHMNIKNDIKILQQQQIKIKTTLDHTNQDIERVRANQTEIGKDIKQILKNSNSKRWFFQ